MTRVYIFIIFIIVSLGSLAADFKNETLHYIVSYKWGLIQKDSGEATLTLTDDGEHYNIKMTGKTKPWADRFFQVRDTLEGKIRKRDFKPLLYVKKAHEKDRHSTDVIKYVYGNDRVEGQVQRAKTNKKGEWERSSGTLQASGDVFDMLSIFYFLRKINYDELQTDKTVKAMMFSGSKVEELTITCKGKEKIKLRDKTEQEAYHILFRFTTEGKKKSSDDIETWISTDPSHIPLLIIGNLTIGEVRCYYVK